MRLPTTTHSGAFGKLPRFGDFVRIHSRGVADERFATWLQRATATLATSGAVCSMRPGRFLLSFPGEPITLIGSWCISNDRSLRVFPLTIYARASVSSVYGGLLGCVRGAALFLEEADALLELSPSLELERFRTEVSRMVQTRFPNEHLCRWEREQLEVEIDGDSADAMFGQDAANRAFALRTLIRAVVAGHRGGGVMLCCPATREVERNVWLCLVGALLQEHQVAVSTLWSDSCSYMIFGFGEPRVELLAAFTLPEFSSRFLWRVRTENLLLTQRALESLDSQTQSLLTQSPTSTGSALATLHAVYRSSHQVNTASKE